MSCPSRRAPRSPAAPAPPGARCTDSVCKAITPSRSSGRDRSDCPLRSSPAEMGARVIALDTSPERLQRAKEFGADALIDPSKTDNVVQAIKELTGGLGAHLSLDASSSPQARAQAVRCVRTWGKACFVGEGDTVTLDVSSDILRRQVTHRRILDVFDCRSGRMRALHCRSRHRCRRAVYRALGALPGGRGLSPVRHADQGQGRYSAFLEPKATTRRRERGEAQRPQRKPLR